MHTCIYCNQDKEDDQFSLEHIFPDSIGGNLCSDLFKTHDVCQRCNSISGQFVDGAFIRNWFVKNDDALSARQYLNLESDESIEPLVYMGMVENLPLEKDEVCEMWLGPCGARVYHFHSADEARFIVVNLPGWTKRTAMLSDRTRAVRQVLAKANDPHRLLFIDLAAVFGGLPNLTTALVRSILELSGAFGRLMLDVEAKLFKALSHPGDIEELNERGRVVAGISGDFRLDAFATRLATYRSRERDLESLIGLAVNKPAREWTDRDIEAAVLQFGEWSLAFRRVEALAPLRNRPATRHAIAVIFGPADGSRTLSRIIEVSAPERKKATLLAQEILSTSESQKREVLLAALAEAGARLVAELGGEED